MSESSWGNLSLCPVLNLGDISLHVFAFLEVFWKFSDEMGKVGGGFDEVLEVSLGELRDGLHDILLESLLVDEAFLDLWEVVLFDEVVHEPSEEFFNTGAAEGVGSSDGFNEWVVHFSFNSLNYKTE